MFKFNINQYLNYGIDLVIASLRLSNRYSHYLFLLDIIRIEMARVHKAISRSHNTVDAVLARRDIRFQQRVLLLEILHARQILQRQEVYFLIRIIHVLSLFFNILL